MREQETIRFSFRKVAAVIIPILCVLLSAYCLSATIADSIRLKGSEPQAFAKRAVLAIRDSVPYFQQFGTELFTEPYLKNYYARSYYFTQSTKLDQKELIVSSLKRLTQEYDCVDIFLLAHTNRYLYWFEHLPADLRQKIRLVYNTGCHNAEQGDRWLAMGADAYIGHKGKTSLSPFFYVYFLRRWVSGYALEEAVESSNSIAKQQITRLNPYLPKPTEMDYVEQTHAHLFGNAHLQIDGL